MTVTVTTDRTGPLIADSADPLPFTFQAISAAEIEVYLDDVLVDPNDYTVVLNGDGTGSVVPLDPWDGEVYILSAPSFQQPFTFNRFVPLYPDQIVPPLDRLAKTIVALWGRLTRGMADASADAASAAADAATATAAAATIVGAVDAAVEAQEAAELAVASIPLKVPQAFGAVGDGVTDDHAALQAWLDSGGELFLPPLQFYSSQTLVVRNQVHMRGAGYGFDALIGGGYAAMPGSRIRFPAGVRGLDIQPQTTLTDVATVLADMVAAFTQEGAYGSTFADFALIGTRGGDPEAGFYARTLIHATNVHALQFEGKGFDISASADMADGNSEYGNASVSRIMNCTAILNGSHGLHIRGRDASTILIDNFNSRENGGWGILEEGLLGNTYVKPHIAGNALGSIKSIGAVNSSGWYSPYIEGDVGAPSQIGGANMIFGSDMTSGNVPVDASPSMYAAQLTTIRRLKFIWGADPDFVYPIADECMLYRHFNLGLALAGEGAAADIALINKLGEVTAYLGSGSKLWSFAGDMNMYGVDPIFRMAGTGGVGSQFLMDGGGVTRLQVYTSNAGPVYISADTLIFRDKSTLVDTRLTIDGTGANLGAGKVLKVGGNQVVGARGAAIADVAMAVAAPTKAEYDALATAFNTLLARVRAATGHGLIA